MIVVDAQRDLQRAYVGGGPGTVISGVIWLVAALIAATRGLGPGFVALFFGGMLIFPLAKLASRLAFGRAAEAQGNPFGRMIAESTAALVAGLFVAWLMLALRPALAFPVAAMAVGTRYVLFHTAYGDRTYWVLGGMVSLIGLAGILVPATRDGTALLVGLVEVMAGAILTRRALRQHPGSGPTIH